MNSRLLQNILHIVGIVSSSLTVIGAVYVGKGSYWGIILMVFSALVLRISSEIEYMKVSSLMSEKLNKR